MVQATFMLIFKTLSYYQTVTQDMHVFPVIAVPHRGQAEVAYRTIIHPAQPGQFRV